MHVSERFFLNQKPIVTPGNIPYLKTVKCPQFGHLMKNILEKLLHDNVPTLYSMRFQGDFKAFSRRSPAFLVYGGNMNRKKHWKKITIIMKILLKNSSRFQAVFKSFSSRSFAFLVYAENTGIKKQ
jgi:hypothetical protein